MDLQSSQRLEECSQIWRDNYEAYLNNKQAEIDDYIDDISDTDEEDEDGDGDGDGDGDRDGDGDGEADGDGDGDGEGMLTSPAPFFNFPFIAFFYQARTSAEANTSLMPSQQA